MKLTEKQKSMIASLKRENFEPEDFFKSNTAEAHKIINLPKTKNEAIEIIENLQIVANKIQRIRDLLGCAIIINSAYRCLEVNRLVGSKDTSQHLKGQAVDFVCPDFGNPAAIFTALKKNKVEVDQCLMEGSWIHLSIKASNNRNSFAVFNPK